MNIRVRYVLYPPDDLCWNDEPPPLPQAHAQQALTLQVDCLASAHSIPHRSIQPTLPPLPSKEYKVIL
jgi:hypothetical protein